MTARNRLVITLEMGKTSNAPYYMGCRLELIKKCLYDGVTHGVVAPTFDSKVSGAWALDNEEETES